VYLLVDPGLLSSPKISMKHRGSFPHRMDALTDTTDKETNERTNDRADRRRDASLRTSVRPFMS